MHPLQKDCDPKDPKRFAAWVFGAGVPDVGVREGTYIPNLIAPQLSEKISEMLWDFGFRHHPSKQKKWIDGAGGLGTIGKIVDEPPKLDSLEALAEEFLAEENPQLLEAIRKAPSEEKVRLIQQMEKNVQALQGVIESLKNAIPEGE